MRGSYWLIVGDNLVCNWLKFAPILIYRANPKKAYFYWRDFPKVFLMFPKNVWILSKIYEIL